MLLFQASQTYVCDVLHVHVLAKTSGRLGDSLALQSGALMLHDRLGAL